MTKTTFILIAFLLAAFLSNCSNNEVIEEDKFIKIYTDIIIAQDSIENDPEKLDSLRSEVFKKYNIDQIQYEKTIEYYNEDPERWKSFFEKTIAYIETLKSKAKNDLP